MPYISTANESNRHLAAHTCGKYHYGDMSLIRDCCVADAQYWRATALRVAFTTSHPARTVFRAAYESLTDAERDLVGDLGFRDLMGFGD